MNKVKLSWLFNTISSGTTPPSNKDEYYDNGTINWLNTGDLNDGFVYDIPKKVTFKALGDFSTLKIYKPNSIVMAMYGATIGKLGIINQEFCTNQACVVLSNPKKNVNFKFIYYCLISKREDIINKANGGGQPNISQSIVKNIRIGVPDEKSQEMIAEFLDKKLEMINDLIQSKKTQIELLEEQRQAMITEAVTKGLNPNVKMKDSGVEWVGEIPEHWEVTKLKYLVSEPLKYGANEVAELDDRNLPRYIRITDINARGILRKDIFVSLNLNIAKKYRVLYNDILFARSGATVGKTYIHKEKKEATFAGYLINARVDKNKCDPDFIYYFTKSNIYNSWINSSLIQATIQNVSGEKYSNMPVVLPDFIESFEISRFLLTKSNQIDQMIDCIFLIISKLKEYRQSLIHEAVTGKIPIEEMESYLKEVEKNGD